MSSLEDRLLFAIPKKGRLYETCTKMLEKIGLKFNRKPRHDLAVVSNMPVLLVFLPASDIPTYVAEGSVDMGITGLDFVSENRVEDKVNQILELGFGQCRLQVAVPRVKTLQATAEEVIASLIGGRVVTSFPWLTRKYFAELEKTTPEEISTKIVYVSGSVEAACGLGLADGIVDLVDTGETLEAVGLVPVGTLLSTQAMLISNQSSKRSDLIEVLKLRIQGVINASKYVFCQYNVEKHNMEEAVAITPGKKAPNVTTLDKTNWVSINVMIAKAELAEAMDRLSAVGATDILVMALDNCRV
ncbi:hypothetical protein BB561_006800 [Smittium simulii]|uniref:ATP phosphoribosyltransferase n=1 Tax=Smittium simulii TaxID=133385 RepID=A0A2T9Y1B6_9FUNG|nr:hypothetical protein BB561_006800 [Smittium simulii]